MAEIEAVAPQAGVQQCNEPPACVQGSSGEKSIDVPGRGVRRKLRMLPRRKWIPEVPGAWLEVVDRLQDAAVEERFGPVPRNVQPGPRDVRARQESPPPPIRGDFLQRTDQAAQNFQPQILQRPLNLGRVGVQLYRLVDDTRNPDCHGVVCEGAGLGRHDRRRNSQTWLKWTVQPVLANLR